MGRRKSSSRWDSGLDTREREGEQEQEQEQTATRPASSHFNSHKHKQVVNAHWRIETGLPQPESFPSWRISCPSGWDTRCPRTPAYLSSCGGGMKLTDGEGRRKKREGRTEGRNLMDWLRYSTYSRYGKLR